MKTTSVRFPPEELDELDREAEEADLSRAEYLRELIRTGRESERLQDELERVREENKRLQREHDNELERVRDDYEAKLDDLRRQLAASNRQNDRVEELATFAEREQSIQRKREIRENKRSEAGVLTRASWWLTGGPRISDDDLEESP